MAFINFICMNRARGDLADVYEAAASLMLALLVTFLRYIPQLPCSVARSVASRCYRLQANHARRDRCASKQPTLKPTSILYRPSDLRSQCFA